MSKKQITNDYEDIKSNIIRTYFELRNKNNILPYQTFKIVIIIHPSAFCKLLSDQSIMLFNDVRNNYEWINLFGFKTPVIIDDTIPIDSMFKMLTQKEYEKIELDKVYSKLAIMFG